MFRPTRSLVRHLRPAAFSQPVPASSCRSLRARESKLPILWQANARFASSNGGENKEAAARKKPDDGLMHDIGVVQDTFRLDRIPKESHILGLAGTVPYLATSLSTIFLAWDLQKELPTGNALYDSIIIPHDQAQYLLSIIEPLQLGYGAVIISFLGAIHWGLEYAEKSSHRERTRFRYGMGVAASVVAWPTLLMPIEYGLTSQFMAFVALYFADAKASSRGWAPKWYGQYRFMLTAMVGFAIFISLVGRSEIEKSERLSKQHLRTSMNRPGLADTETNWAKIEAEEMKKEKEEKERKAKKEQKNKKDKAGDKSGKDEKNGGDDKDKSSSEDDKKGDKKDSKEDKGGDEDKKGEEKKGKKDEGKDEGKDESKDSDKKDENDGKKEKKDKE